MWRSSTKENLKSLPGRLPYLKPRLNVEWSKLSTRFNLGPKLFLVYINDILLVLTDRAAFSSAMTTQNSHPQAFSPLSTVASMYIESKPKYSGLTIHLFPLAY